MRVATLLLATLAGARAGALELNKGNFDKEVKQSGKNGAPSPTYRTARRLASPPAPRPLGAFRTRARARACGVCAAFVKFLAPW